MSRKIDQLIAVHVFGWGESKLAGLSMLEIQEIPNYSTNIKDAWEVIEQVDNLCVQIDNVGSPAGYTWRCLLGWGDDPISVHAEASEVSMAICLAALKAKGVSVDE